MSIKTHLVVASLICVATFGLARLGSPVAQAACANQYCKTKEHKVVDTGELFCKQKPCYEKTVESWTEKCAGGATGKNCTTYLGILHKTTLRTCVAGECKVTKVTTDSGAGGHNRCVTTDCPVVVQPAPVQKPGGGQEDDPAPEPLLEGDW